MNTLKIFQTTDIHGNIFPTNYVDDRQWGLGKVASCIKTNKAQHNLILDSGDVLQGSSLAFYSEKHKITNPSIIEAFNTIGYDAISLGNHEFNYGLDYLRKHYSKFTGDILCANIEGLPFDTKPYSIYTYDNIKVAVIGFTTDYIPNWELADNIDGITFKSPVDVYKHYESELVANSDIILVNYHGGFECSLDDARTPTESQSGENIASQLIREFDSIDILLTGHQHRTIATKTNEVVCMQPSFNGSQVSEITVDIDSKEIVDYKLLSTAQYDIDHDIQSQFEKLHNECNEYLNTTLAHVDTDLSITDVTSARLNSHPLLAFLGQAFNDYQNVDVVALSLFDSAIGFTKDISIRQVNQNYPFPNTIMKIEMTGKDIVTAIEQSNNYYTLINGVIAVNPDYISPKLKHYNYDMFWGISYTVIVNESKNETIDVQIKGKDIQDDKVYTMLVSNYRFNDRADYPIYKNARVINESQGDAVQILLNYLEANKNIKFTNDLDYLIKPGK